MLNPREGASYDEIVLWSSRHCGLNTRCQHKVNAVAKEDVELPSVFVSNRVIAVCAGQVCTPIDLSSLLPLSLPALPTPTLPVVLGVSVPYLILYQQSERCIHRPANKASKAFASMQTFSNNTRSPFSPCSLLLISICDKTIHYTSAYLRKYPCP